MFSLRSVRGVYKRLGESEYHIGVVPAPRSSRGDDDVLMGSGPVQDGLDGAPRVVHVSEVAPVVTRLTDGCVVGLQAQEGSYMSYNIMYGVIMQLMVINLDCFY